MKEHILTVVVEDYFHAAALRGAVLRKHWDRLETRVEDNVSSVLELLAGADARATFFIWGRIAELVPELVQRIVRAGHEVASRGHLPRSLKGLTRAEFLADERKARDALEAAGAHRIIGYRSPSWLGVEHLWVLDVLAEEGYAYDSSINPALGRFSRHAEAGAIHRHHHATLPLSLWEVPISTVSVGGIHLPISGGNYVRQLPHTLLGRVVAWKSARQDEPLVFYFMSWEMDASQPHIQGLSPLQRVRHYRKLGKPLWVLKDYVSKYRFVGIADYLGLAHDQALAPRAPEPVPELRSDSTGEPVTLVVPIFNEEKNITYFRRTVLELRSQLAGKYRIHLVLVDDCSTDGTQRLLAELFGDVPDCTIMRHEVNRGIAAGIMTGIRAASTEVVCSIDCDCSYDPHDLEQMLPLIAGADLVSASPYHPEGAVFNVPSWRLMLSKTLSLMYSTILRRRIYTYTSCFRVYRRSAMLPLSLRHDGFLGMAEMLIELDLAGGRIIEHPATLGSRLLGESKMKIARTIRGHLGLLAELALSGRERAARPPDAGEQPRGEGAAA